MVLEREERNSGSLPEGNGNFSGRLARKPCVPFLIIGLVGPRKEEERKGKERDGTNVSSAVDVHTQEFSARLRVLMFLQKVGIRPKSNVPLPQIGTRGSACRTGATRSIMLGNFKSENERMEEDKEQQGPFRTTKFHHLSAASLAKAPDFFSTLTSTSTCEALL